MKQHRPELADVFRTHHSWRVGIRCFRANREKRCKIFVTVGRPL